MRFEISSKKEYHEIMIAIYELMNKGESNLTRVERNKLAAMAVAAEKYEDDNLGLNFKKPKTIPEAVEIKLFEKRMKQSELADQLGLAKSKVSEILSGKRKPDIVFIKGIYKVLKIDAGFLLEHA